MQHSVALFILGRESVRAVISGSKLTVEHQANVSNAFDEYKALTSELTSMNTDPMSVYYVDCSEMHERIWECQRFLSLCLSFLRTLDWWTPMKDRRMKQDMEFLRIYRRFFFGEIKKKVSLFNTFSKDRLEEIFDVELDVE